MRPLVVLAAGVVVAASASSMAEAPCVGINAAPPEELMRIVHIDKIRAAEAVEIRARRPFADVRDLTRIRGIGPSRIIDIEAQGLACVGSETPAGLRPEMAGQARIIDGRTLDIASKPRSGRAALPVSARMLALSSPWGAPGSGIHLHAAPQLNFQDPMPSPVASSWYMIQ